jgi:outer membrane murein-binding lipoprotein Lpp
MKKIFILIITISFIIGCTNGKKVDYLTEEINNLRIENDSLKNENLRIRSQIDSLRDQVESNPNYWFNKDIDGASLVKKGIKNPEQFVKTSLRNNLELIPIDAVLGGTMRFGKMQLLSKSWIIAEYDDGHILGRSIFKFELNSNNELEFKELDSIVN